MQIRIENGWMPALRIAPKNTEKTVGQTPALHFTIPSSSEWGYNQRTKGRTATAPITNIRKNVFASARFKTSVGVEKERRRV
jgi:hypothetical protein